MKPLFLIACSAAKLAHPAPAAELYTGQAFKLAMAAAAAVDAEVLILSALHGAVQAGQVLAPYDRALADMNTQQRKVWAATTSQQLERYRDRITVCLAGKHYAAATTRFAFISYPLAGQGIGEQLATLKRSNWEAHLDIYHGVTA
jgi:cytoplasmic iron level regulating protein YaaA (DUF328/UPF0246 family)